MHKLIRPPLAGRIYALCLGMLAIVALMFAFEKPAQAYVDPGSGFVFFQIAGSMAAGALFYLRHRVKKLFGFMRKAEQPILSSDETGAADTHS